MKYTISFETDERLTEEEENALIDCVNQFGGEVSLTDDAERRTK